jgi:signal transduction histidine kinase
MLKTIRKVSLRTRLALLAAFAIVALVVALFVAWRLARATETFALRQADASVHAAARELARELQAHPDGYQTIEQALPAPPDRLREKGPRAPDERARRVPPHVENLFAAFSDPLTRLTAITLHRFPNVAGGFYSPADGVLVGFAFPQDAAARASGNAPSDLVDMIRALASQTAATGAPASRTSQIGSDRILLVAYPAQADGLAVAWAMQRLSHLSGVSDWPNIAALVALALSILAVSGIALITVRDLRSGVTGIEAGLAGLTSDLSRQLSSPDTAELARIAAAINELAATLRANIARQAELEQELAHRERLSALGRVVAGVAHEVRNPLAAIKLKVQLARRSSYAPEKLAETFNVVTAEIERLDTLVRRLLELGGQQRLELGAVDLCELVSRRAAFLTDLATRAGVEIATSAPPESVVVQGDGNRLAQVVDNIIQNALDAMPDGGQLTITCDTFQAQSGTASARLSFEDTGHGIPQADHEHIFEPFHTGRNTGTGLGLAIARAIVEEHGGRLGFVSREGSGASFVIELPLSPAALMSDEL